MKGWTCSENLRSYILLLPCLFFPTLFLFPSTLSVRAQVHICARACMCMHTHTHTHTHACIPTHRQQCSQGTMHCSVVLRWRASSGKVSCHPEGSTPASLGWPWALHLLEGIVSLRNHPSAPLPCLTLESLAHHLWPEIPLFSSLLF